MNQAEMLTRFVRELDLDLVLMAGRYSLLDQGPWPSCCRPASSAGWRW